LQDRTASRLGASDLDNAFAGSQATTRRWRRVTVVRRLHLPFRASATRARGLGRRDLGTCHWRVAPLQRTTGHPLAGSARDGERLWRLVRPQNMAICSRLGDQTASAIRSRAERVTGLKTGGRLRPTRQQKMPICRMFS